MRSIRSGSRTRARSSPRPASARSSRSMPQFERPQTADRTAEVLHACSAGQRTVRVRGGGTKDHLGTRRETDIVLETGALAGIVDHVPEDLTVTVRGGTTLAAVRDALAAHGQFLPLDPPHLALGA